MRRECLAESGSVRVARRKCVLFARSMDWGSMTTLCVETRTERRAARGFSTWWEREEGRHA